MAPEIIFVAVIGPMQSVEGGTTSWAMAFANEVVAARKGNRVPHQLDTAVSNLETRF